jgi:hypothetical protein
MKGKGMSNRPVGQSSTGLPVGIYVLLVLSDRLILCENLCEKNFAKSAKTC